MSRYTSSSTNMSAESTGRGTGGGRKGHGDHCNLTMTSSAFQSCEEKLDSCIFDYRESTFAEKYFTTLEEVDQFIRNDFSGGEHVVQE